MQNMINNVYTDLKERTEEIAKEIAKYNALKEKTESGTYSAEYIEQEIRPEMEEIKRSIEESKATAISSAKSIVNVYQDELRRKDELNPQDITEDAKLFNIGIKLNKGDIEAILCRNEKNSTMQQLCLRYAQENGIELGGKTFIGHKAEIQEAAKVASIVDYFGGWIDKPNAGEMLDKFFNVQE